MEFTIKINNPFTKLKNWFLYNKSFWTIHKVKKSKLCAYDIDRIEYHDYIIRHKILNKIISYEGWGKELTQQGVNGANELIVKFK